MKKTLKIIGLILALAFISCIIWVFIQTKDRHPDYWVDLELEGEQNEILAGFSKVSITPTYFETWTDANGDAQYNPEDGDTFEDTNQNGEFDAIWLAGFQNSRPAQGVLDSLWARTMVLDAGNVKMALCVIDMIGFGNDEIISTRKLIEAQIPWIDYVIIASTHVHSSPDLMGMWGPSSFKRGVNPDYLDQVQRGIVKSMEEAYNSLRPAEFKFAEETDRLKPLVGDTRPPVILDASLRLMQVLDRETGETLGTIMNWGNHPETLWSQNIQISSDFPSTWRDGVENGISLSDSTSKDGLGGVAIFLNGAVGGLMTTHPSMPIQDPISGEELLEPSPEKMKAQGDILAQITLETLADSSLNTFSKLNLRLKAKSFALPLDNKLFQLAAVIGIFDRGFVSWKKIRSEIAIWELGPASFLHVPGELYPEILHGGIESPEGADFGIEPVEVPAINALTSGQFRFFGGISNDMIGYIIPKSQWDVEPPYTYDYEDRPYGEINSVGPETAPILHQELKYLLQDFYKKNPQ